MASSSSLKEKHNFQCVTEANFELIKLPLKDILSSQIKPVDLFLKIKASRLLSGRNKLHPDQLNLCYFPPPLLPDYSKFDVTLLYTLIRNLSSGLEPTKGWGNEPGPNDTHIGDDIERLRWFRNKNFAHSSSAAIPDDTFKVLYNTLKSVFNRLKAHPGCSVDYEQELIEIKSSKFTYEKLEILKTFLERDKRTCIPDVPSISINGEDEVICGNSVKFKAIVDQSVDQSLFPVWSITWQKRRGENIRCIDISDEKYSGSTNSKLLIRSACKGDEGEYSAFLSIESNGKKYKLESNTISLLVVGEMPFLNDLEVSTEEEKIIIHYNYGVLEKSPSVQHIEWRKNDKLLNFENEKYIGGNLKAKTFTIISPSNDDRGKYSCTVTNAVGPVTKHVNFDIPSVELSVESNGFFGTKATMRSNVLSCPLPEKIQWQKSNDNRIFLPIDIRAPAYSGSTDVPKSAILVIPKMSFDDKLFYRLFVWNKIGQNYSNIIYLNVTGSPPNIIVSQETNINNRSVKLCGNVFVYDNSPGILSVYWTKDGKKIDINETGGRFSQVTVDKPSLKIKDVNLDDIGDYQLTATNAVGSTTCDVIKLGPPSLLLEKKEDEKTGRQQFTLSIQSFPAPCDIKWSVKVNDDDIFTPIDINAEEYKGTTEYLPHPVLVVNQGNQLENYTFKIEVNSFVGSTIEVFSGQKYPSITEKEGSLESTLYEDKGAGLKFALLNNDLANQFPVEKVKLLKFIIQSSGKVKDMTSLKSADTAMECFTILQDEKIFSKRDVIFVQFLCKVTGCKELYEKCKDYALSQNALCCFERQIENGYTKVQFHVQGDLNNYTKENIVNIVKTVAGILNCRTDEILVNGVYHSRSFMLVLSMKDIYISKLTTLSERDCRHLTRLHIDYFILNQKIFQLASSKDLVESEVAVLDEKLQFAKLCNDLAKDFPLQKFQQLRSILSASEKTRTMKSLMAANSVLECLTILFEENIFSEADVGFIQFLCKETNCEELHNKCEEYARGQEIHFFKEGEQKLKRRASDIIPDGEPTPKRSGSQYKADGEQKLKRRASDGIPDGEPTQKRSASQYKADDKDFKTTTPTRMNTISYQYLIRHCSRCLGDAAFFCATCDCSLCLPCKENHLNDLSTLDHDVMIYPDKDRCLSEQEKCMEHPHIACKWYCESCKIPYCDCCTEHITHRSFDIKKKVKIIRLIRSECLFFSSILLENIKSDFKIYQTKLFTSISNMQANVLELKTRIDSAFREFDFKHRCSNQTKKLLKRIENVYEFEQRSEQLTNKGVQFIKFIKTYRLSKIMSYQRLECHAHLSLTDPLSFKDIEEPFCEIAITEKGQRTVGHDSELKLMYSPKLQNSLTLEHVNNCCHISIKTSDKVWVSGKDYLILTNTKGATSYCLKTFNEFSGLHSINKDKKLIYIDDEYNVITLPNDLEKKKTNTSIKTFEWKPKCLSFCRSTDDLLVGMYNKSEEEGKVIRYSQSGEQTQTIQEDKRGNKLYSKPSYIVENNNFDVVVSDTAWTTVNNSSEESSAIVGTNRKGKYRFKYTGHLQNSKIVSRGLCIDALSHIILCDNKTSTVQMLDCNGKFMSHILIRPAGILKPHGLGYDFKTHLLWVGSHRNKICVYRYINRRDILTESKSSKSDAIESSNEFQIIDTRKSEINEVMLNLSVFEEAKKGITLMMSVHDAGNEDEMSESEKTNEELMSVSNEECATLMTMPLCRNEDLIPLPYIELYRTVENFYGCYHISCVTTDIICISEGTNILINKRGNTVLFQHYLPEFAFNGLHTMDKENELIYINSDYDIYRWSLETETKIPLLQSNSTTWKPHCVYCSPLSRDLLVGMFRKDLKIGMVIRYNNNGKLKQSIICDKFGQELYNEPRYITENNNRDVVVSDSDWETGAVVVTERGGQHRFTYTGHPSGSGFLPRGICTDRFSNIIVCDSSSKTIHVIDKDGRFLSKIFSNPKLMSEPSCLSYAFRDDLFLVGSYNNNTIGICRYVTGKSKARTDKTERRIFTYGSTPCI